MAVLRAVASVLPGTFAKTGIVCREALIVSGDKLEFLGRCRSVPCALSAESLPQVGTVGE